MKAHPNRGPRSPNWRNQLEKFGKTAKDALRLCIDSLLQLLHALSDTNNVYHQSTIGATFPKFAKKSTCQASAALYGFPAFWYI